MNEETVYDVAVVGGGPAGATAATDLAHQGHSVVLIERGGRIKPCGGAIPPRLMQDFDIPDSLLVSHATSARMISPGGRRVDMPINGFVGMVDREDFDEWLRERAAGAGAARVAGRFQRLERDAAGIVLHYLPAGTARGSASATVRARLVVGADGARSEVAHQEIAGGDEIPYVAAYHEIVESPSEGEADFDGQRCEVYYQGRLSPDFYAWVFPHGERTSVGVGTAVKGFSMRRAIAELRQETGMGERATVRCEGAPIPLKMLPRWDNGRDVVLAGDAAGGVAPASGEGIYYAMVTGRFVADAAADCLASGDARALRRARKRFKREHGRVFWILGIMQRFWYAGDKRRERFVAICRDPDVQRLTWEAYMHKRLVKASPLAHLRIFCKDMAHLLGLAPVK